jgi:hypothetical protein
MKRTWKERPWRTVFAAGMVIMSACAESAIAPSPPPALDVVDVSTARETGIFVANAHKYSDVGRRPATGRAGTALAAMQALLARDGSAVVEVVAGEEWTGWTRERKMRDDPFGDATLAKVQLNAFDPSGAPQFTRNFNHLGSASAALPANGLMRGGRAQVHANVRGADASRTGVVVIDAPVLLRPDLAVMELQRPPRAVKNTAVPIVAVVRELNGDLGAWADCVLYVNGVEADRAWGVWVDAGGTVTCTMTHMFRAVGESQVEVRVEQVAPGDYDPANNSATGLMSVIFVRSDFFSTASFEDRTFSWRTQYESSWSGPGGVEGGEWSTTEEGDGRVHQAQMSAYLPHAAAFPLTEVFARQSTRDEVAHGVTFRNLAADWTYADDYARQTCVSRGFTQVGIGRWWLYVCSHELFVGEGEVVGHTTIEYSRYAGDVTYASRGHSRYWNRDLGIDDVYSHNYTSSDVVGRFVSYGLEYGFFVRLIDRGQTYTMNPFVGLLPFESGYSSPRSCWGWDDPGGSMRSCSEYTSRESGVRGWVYGEPSR